MGKTLFALVVVALLAASAMAMTTKVDARSEVCLKQHVGRDQPLTFQYRVTAGGKLDLDVSIYDSNGHRLNFWKEGTEGNYQVRGDATNSYFRFCFNNEMARFTPKWVNFYFHIGPPPSAAKAKDLDPLEQQVRKARKEIDDFQAAQFRLRTAEHDHRNTIEDANERILLWTIFETVCLFVMGIFQIFFLKRFLEVKTSV